MNTETLLTFDYTLVDFPRAGGLCMDCRLQVPCSRVDRTTVHHCELWEGDLHIQIRKGSPAPQPAATTVMGLCCNCNLQGSCSISATEGGIWYCELYE